MFGHIIGFGLIGGMPTFLIGGVEAGIDIAGFDLAATHSPTLSLSAHFEGEE